MRALDWVVIGGGPHGVCAAAALSAAGADLAVVDPSAQLLSRWMRRAQAVDMTWMRSPVAHHLAARPASLHHFLHRPENADVRALARPILRPSHAGFIRHCRHLIDDHALNRKLRRGWVEGLEREGETWVVRGQDLELRARRVLLATGSNRPKLPGWASRLRREGAPVRHVFEEGAQLARDIIGAGISAVQRALHVHRTTERPVRLWVRQPVRVADFDYDRTWTTPRFIAWWSKLDPRRQHGLLRHPSTRSSVPPGLKRRLDKATRRGGIELRCGPVRATPQPQGYGVRIHQGPTTIEAEALTLATGLEPQRLDPWLRAVASRHDLPTHARLPRLASNMLWGRELYVTGPLARLRLGPMAANLIGARWATSCLPNVRLQP